MAHKNLLIFMPSIEGGGVEKNFFIITNYLAGQKINIKVITADKKFNHLFSKKIKIINPISFFWSHRGRYLKYFICLSLLIKEHLKIKKFLTLSFQANIYCIIVTKIFNNKIISRSNSSSAGWSKNFLKNFIFRRILMIADKVIVNSKDFKRELDRKFNINTKCIYNPFNKSTVIKLSKKKLNKSVYRNNKTLKILNVGRLVDQKDQMTLLKAIKLVQNKIPIEVLIIGNGIKKNELQNYIYKNNLKKTVRIINFMNNPYNYIQKCELFILTSIYEGLPNVLLEAQCLKKFIISTRCPTGPREILMDGKVGHLFSPTNEIELANKILDYYINKKKYNRMINLGYKNLYRFDGEINLEKYYNLIKKYL
jgi:glycosyltransferase involved in cell wall biosynthesis